MPKVRDAYGRNQAGARMLLSRRLVEAGARFVTMTYGGWDMHDRIQTGIERNLPSFDQGILHTDYRPLRPRAAGQHPGLRLQ